MRAFRLTPLLLALIACATPSERGPGIDSDRAMKAVGELATTIGPRVQSTDASRRAAAWIETQLRSSGIPVERMEVGTVELPAVTVMGAIYRRAHPVTVSDPNLVVRFGTGSGPALLVMAHYDTVALSPGAVDNAAGVAVLIELARVLHAEPPPQPVIIAFTAAEEIGLAGAEALAAEIADRVAFAIALDLIGGDGELVVNGASTLVGATELRWLADAGERAGVAIGVPAAHRVISRWWRLAERSDHGPFTRRGTRAIHFYNRGHDGDWIDLAYHSAGDDASRVQRESVDDLGRVLRALVAAPVPAHGGDGYWLPFVHGVVVPRAALVALEIALVLISIGSLVFSRAGLLAWLARSRDDRRGPAILLGAVCYALAVAVAVVIEKATSGEHVAPWLHAPGRALVAYACVIAGAFGLATRVVSRFAPWRGEGRFVALAALVPLAIGLAWLAFGAAEIAWVWLVPSAAIAVAPLTRAHAAEVYPSRAGASGMSRVARAVARALGIARGALVPLAVAVTALPLVLVLYPLRLREAVWNGFLPVTIPLSAGIGLLGIPVAAAAAWALRRRNTPGPMGTLLLGVGCAVLMIAGVVVAVTAPVACTPAEFVKFLLACERV